MTDVHASVVAAVGLDAAFTKDHQAYFVKSAEKVNSTLHAAICKFCNAQDVVMKDNRTCLWQARDCIRHLARCPHVTEGVRIHFKEEARLLNARLNVKKRSFQDMSSKAEDAQEIPFPLPATQPETQPAAPTQAQDQSAAAPDTLPTVASLQGQLQSHALALARLQSVLDRHDRLACHAVLMTATSKLDDMMQGTPEPAKHSSLAQDVAGLSRTKLSGFRLLDGMGLSSTDVEFAQTQKGRSGFDCLQEFTQQEMAEAVARRQGADATAYQRLFQFAFATCAQEPQ